MKTATKTVEMFKTDMAGVVDFVSDDKIIAELEKLAEEFRYSDPVSGDATKELETKISAEIAELRDMVQTEDSEKIKVKITHTAVKAMCVIFNFFVLHRKLRHRLLLRLQQRAFERRF